MAICSWAAPRRCLETTSGSSGCRSRAQAATGARSWRGRSDKVQASELARLVQRLWRTTLQLPLRESPDVSAPPGAALTASIRFGGSMHAVMSVTCGDALARQIAASMFRARPDRISDRDVHDAL